MSFVPENDLEKALVVAATDVTSRAEFYRLLLDSNLFMVSVADDVAPGAILSAGAKFTTNVIRYQNREILAVFSSPARLREFASGETKYVAMKGRDIFAATLGQNFVLNPGSQYGKEITPTEIGNLLNINPSAVMKRKVEKPSKAIIGQPAVYPQTLVDGLRALFADRPDVVSAHLLQIAYEGSKESSHPLIGIRTDGKWQSLLSEASRVAGFTARGIVVDFVQIRDKKNEPIELELLKVPPFYKRS